MQVYELIYELSKLPAGAEVEFSTIMDTDEVNGLKWMDSEDNKNAYSFRTGIKEVEMISDTLVAIYR